MICYTCYTTRQEDCQVQPEIFPYALSSSRHPAHSAASRVFSAKPARKMSAYRLCCPSGPERSAFSSPAVSKTPPEPITGGYAAPAIREYPSAGQPPLCTVRIPRGQASTPSVKSRRKPICSAKCTVSVPQLRLLQAAAAAVCTPLHAPPPAMQKESRIRRPLAPVKLSADAKSETGKGKLTPYSRLREMTAFRRHSPKPPLWETVSRSAACKYRKDKPCSSRKKRSGERLLLIRIQPRLSLGFPHRTPASLPACARIPPRIKALFARMAHPSAGACGFPASSADHGYL